MQKIHGPTSTNCLLILYIAAIVHFIEFLPACLLIECVSRYVNALLQLGAAHSS